MTAMKATRGYPGICYVDVFINSVTRITGRDQPSENLMLTRFDAKYCIEIPSYPCTIFCYNIFVKMFASIISYNSKDYQDEIKEYN